MQTWIAAKSNQPNSDFVSEAGGPSNPWTTSLTRPETSPNSSPQRPRRRAKYRASTRVGNKIGMVNVSLRESLSSVGFDILDGFDDISGLTK